MKRFAAALLAIVIIAVLTVPVFATDPDYVGQIDPETGEPVTSGTSAEDPTLTRILVSRDVLYDRSRHVFVFQLGTGMNEVYSTVADGMIVNTPVSITASTGITPQVYRNGELISNEDLTHLNTIGSYVVSAKEGNNAERVLSFTIVGETTNLTGSYTMPDGFYISSVSINGEEAPYDRFGADLSEEGSYHIEYYCPAVGTNYTLDITVDHTPPEISFSGKFDKNGRARSAVDVVGLEKTDTVRMTYNGKEKSFPSDAHLKSSGLYTIEVFDKAGNSTSQQLTILVYFDVSSILFFVLVAASIGFVVGYILYKRKKLKII